jgi:hypothetical protein
LNASDPIYLELVDFVASGTTPEDGLSGDADAFLRGQTPVAPDPHAKRHDTVALVVVALGQQRTPIRVEAGVGYGENETAGGPQNPANRPQQRGYASDIHQGQIAHRCIEPAGAERGKLILARHIDHSIFDPLRVFGRA